MQHWHVGCLSLLRWGDCLDCLGEPDLIIWVLKSGEEDRGSKSQEINPSIQLFKTATLNFLLSFPPRSDPIEHMDFISTIILNLPNVLHLSCWCLNLQCRLYTIPISYLDFHNNLLLGLHTFSFIFLWLTHHKVRVIAKCKFEKTALVFKIPKGLPTEPGVKCTPSCSLQGPVWCDAAHFFDPTMNLSLWWLCALVIPS